MKNLPVLVLALLCPPLAAAQEPITWRFDGLTQIAGLSTTLLAGIALVYLPSAFAQVTPILFGLGAIQVAKFPNGIMTENARQVLWAWGKVRSVSRSKRSPDAGPPVVVGGELS